MEKENKQDELNNIEYIPVSIIDNDKQLSIRIPAKIVDTLQINPEKDSFVFILDKEHLFLQGVLMDKENVKKLYNEKK